MSVEPNRATDGPNKGTLFSICGIIRAKPKCAEIPCFGQRRIRNFTGSCDGVFFGKIDVPSVHGISRYDTQGMPML